MNGEGEQRGICGSGSCMISMTVGQGDKDISDCVELDCGMLHSGIGQFSQDIDQMPEKPFRKTGHRRVRSEIITLPDDLCFDSELGIVPGIDGPSFSDDTDEDLVSMYLVMDKINTSSATASSCQLSGSFYGVAGPALAPSPAPPMGSGNQFYLNNQAMRTLMAGQRFSHLNNHPNKQQFQFHPPQHQQIQNQKRDQQLQLLNQPQQELHSQLNNAVLTSFISAQPQTESDTDTKPLADDGSIPPSS